MAPTQGLKVGLYFLLVTDSQLRRELEGKTQTPVKAPGNGQDILDRFKLHLVGDGTAAHTGIGLAAGDIPVNIQKLFVSTGGSNNVTTDHKTILSAVDGPYDPDAGPCPVTIDEFKILKALKGAGL